MTETANTEKTINPPNTPRNIFQRIYTPSSPDDTSIVIAFIALALVVAVGVGIFKGGGTFLQLLQNTEISRGLITFLVALATVAIATILVIYAVTGNDDKERTKERFSQGKEVLTTLVGILGTVLGFYFGSAEKGAANDLALAEPHFQALQLTTHISGGSPPYRYSISSEKQEFTKIEGHVSNDGWIIENLDKQPNAGAVIMIEVLDARNRSISKTATYPTGGQNISQAPSKIQAAQSKTP